MYQIIYKNVQETSSFEITYQFSKYL